MNLRIFAETARATSMALWETGERPDIELTGPGTPEALGVLHQQSRTLPPGSLWIGALNGNGTCTARIVIFDYGSEQYTQLWRQMYNCDPPDCDAPNHTCPRCTRLLLLSRLPGAIRHPAPGHQQCADCVAATNILSLREAGGLSTAATLVCMGAAGDLPEPLATEWAADANLNWWMIRKTIAYERAIPHLLNSPLVLIEEGLIEPT